MTKKLAPVLAIAMSVFLTTTAQAQLTPDPLYDFRASNNEGYPDFFTNLGVLEGELTVQGTPPQRGFDTFDFYNVQEGNGSYDFLTGGDDLIIGDGFTYEMLLRRTGDGFGTNEHQLAAIAEGGDNEVFLFVGTKSDNRGGVDFGDTPDIFTLPAGEWTHFMISVDDETDVMKVYVNGGAPTTINQPINLNENPANDVTLFKTRGEESGIRRFDGDISEARLYDFVLTDEQARANYEVFFPDGFQQPPARVGGRDEIGMQPVIGSFANQVFTEAEDSAPGLAQSWYGSSGPTGRNRQRNKAGVDAGTQLNDRVAYFHAEDGTWFSGSYDVLDVHKYPIEIEELGVIETEGGDEGLDFYYVKSEGEILIPESGTIRFIDGVDAYAYLAIDIDRSGVAGDSESEVLLNDDDWTDALAQQPPPDDGDPPPPINEVNFEGIAEGGEWVAMEFNVLEVDGGDSAMLYWDALDENGAFPAEEFVGVLDEDAAGLLIPDTHLRGPTSPPMHVSSDVEGLFPERSLGWEVDVDPANGTSDTFVVEDLGEGREEIDSEDLTTILDVEGLELHVNPLGEVAEGDSFQVFVADVITGMPAIATEGWSFDAATGFIVFGDVVVSTCESLAASRIVGDADGNGEVAFNDFLALANNFGTDAGYAGGDFDCNGEVAFNDFLALANNFGATAAGAASSVPEPSGLVLCGAACLVGLLRRRS